MTEQDAREPVAPDPPIASADPDGTPNPEPPPVPWRWTDALLVLLLSTLFVIVGAPLVYLALGDEVAEPLLLLVAAAATGGITWLVAARRYGVQWARLLWGHRRPTGRDVLIGLGAAGLALIGVNVIVAVLTAAGGQPPDVQTGLREAARDRALLPLVALAAVVVVPVAEELLYRGMLFQGLRTRLGRWPAIGLSALVFGLLHYQDSLSGTLLLLAAFYPLGMWLAWLFDRRGTLVVPIVAHMAYNGLNLLLLVLGPG